MENKRKHLEMIQAIIERMAGNLFYLKGWAITLIAALFALAAKDSNRIYMYLVYFPVILFWLMDAYFLSQERLFRDLYDDVRELEEKDIDFAMNTKKYRDNDGNSLWAAFWSPTLVVFYGSLTGILILIMYLTSK